MTSAAVFRGARLLPCAWQAEALLEQANRRKELNSLVSRLARKRGVPDSHIHAQLRRECGGPKLAQANTGQIEARIKLVRRWLDRAV